MKKSIFTEYSPTEVVDHLSFIYARMKNVHGEDPNVNYMLRFREIIGDIVARNNLLVPADIVEVNPKMSEPTGFLPIMKITAWK